MRRSCYLDDCDGRRTTSISYGISTTTITTTAAAPATPGIDDDITPTFCCAPATCRIRRRRRSRILVTSEKPSRRSILSAATWKVAVIAVSVMSLFSSAPAIRRCAAFSSVASSRIRRPSSSSSSAGRARTLSSTTVQQEHVELRHAEFGVAAPQDSAKHHHKHSPVLLLHGLLGNKRNFASVATSLSSQLDKKRRVFGLDLRNHGMFMNSVREVYCLRPRIYSLDCVVFLLCVVVVSRFAIPIIYLRSK